jgi:probable HAF family extracellular repeat protein
MTNKFVAGLLMLATAAVSAAGRRTRSFVAIDLGSLGGSVSEAWAVNANGLVVGRSSIAGNPSTYHAFAWSPESGMTDLGTLGGESSANAVTDAGVIAGYSYLPGETAYHAFVWTHGNGLIDLGTLGGSGSAPAAINREGRSSATAT